MFRSYLIAAGAALLCTSAAAQHKLDPSRMYPITTPIKNAGTVDVTTGKWTKPGQQVKVGSSIIFNNSCSWQTQAYYGGFDWCEENYDEGRIPSPTSPGAPAGAEASNEILSVQVSYCTFVGPLATSGGYDMDLAFFDKLGGDCAGTVPPTPPPVSSQATAYLPLAGLGLPGSTAFGFQACWVVTLDTSNTGFFLASDGEGIFDGVGADDKFIWMQRQNQTEGALNQSLPEPDGFFISGEPATGGYGACSYNIPCGIDAITGDTCGTGLDTFDASWINVDGIGAGASNTPPGCANAVSQYGFGTNCYYFGGYPTNPLASYWLVVEGTNRGGALKYCTQTKVTSVTGCIADFSVNDLTLSGVWSTTNIPRDASLGTGNVVGLYLYTNGVGNGQSTFSANIPFGTLCLSGTSRSGPAIISAAGGVCNVGPMNVSPASLTTPAVAVGQDINAQFWYRDPITGNTGNANFSNAVFYTLQ